MLLQPTFVIVRHAQNFFCGLAIALRIRRRKHDCVELFVEFRGTDGGSLTQIGRALEHLPVLVCVSWISTAVGLFNLLPVPMMDGGRLLLVRVESPSNPVEAVPVHSFSVQVDAHHLGIPKLD